MRITLSVLRPAGILLAIFLAAMILIGLQPGPGMADPNRDLNLTYTVVWTLALANVIGTAACIALSPSIARLTTIRFVLFAPFMILIIVFGAFQSTRSFEDIVALLLVALTGIFLKRFGWPRPAPFRPEFDVHAHLRELMARASEGNGRVLLGLKINGRGGGQCAQLEQVTTGGHTVLPSNGQERDR